MSPYLSVVAVSRNDDHGGDPLIRTQIFITNLARQCEKYRLHAELIIVDWNPVAGRPGLAAVLNVPSEATYLRSRVVTVPATLHQQLKYADRLPLFQMIAKNVGIRRAMGKFILATNIDIIFSDELMRFVSGQKLDPKKLYRVDRYDIHSGLSKDLTLDGTLDYAWANPIRAHRRYQPEQLVQHLYGGELFKRVCVPDRKFQGKVDGVEVINEDDVWQIRPERSIDMDHLHTNACGDFTLLSREGWEAVRGYPEFEAFSFNIDSLGMVAAHYAGYQEVSLLPPCLCFHIEHGSGWTPEGEKQLFDRLLNTGILSPEWPLLMPLVEEIRAKAKPLEFNHRRWGLADFELPEQALGDAQEISVAQLERVALQAEDRAVSSITPAYDLDRLTLASDRGMALSPGVVAIANPQRIALYIPDSVGCYSERRSITYHARIEPLTKVTFRLMQFAHQFPLRFDPCQCAGHIKISSITAFDTLNNRVVWELDGRYARKLRAGGTARLRNHGCLGLGGWWHLLFGQRSTSTQQPIHLISSGEDPQLIFPPLPDGVGFPLVISLKMKFIPFE